MNILRRNDTANGEKERTCHHANISRYCDESITRTLRSAIQIAFLGANLLCQSNIQQLFQMGIKQTASVAMYSLKCICIAAYVGRPVRCLSQTISEQPRCFSRVGSDKNSNAISPYLLNYSQPIILSSPFSII